MVPLIIPGVVASGLGRGGYFISLDWVRARLLELMGERPFPGTLNLRIPPELREELFLRRKQFSPVMAPEGAVCAGYLVAVALEDSRGQQLEAWAILPDSTVHTDILEIVSPYQLRERMALTDGDKLTVEIYIT